MLVDPRPVEEPNKEPFLRVHTIASLLDHSAVRPIDGPRRYFLAPHRR